VKIRGVRIDRRRRCFHLDLGRKGVLDFPFARSEPRPTREDLVVEAVVDPELANEGITFRLASGAEGAVLADQVLDYHSDPDYVRDLLLYRLTVEALDRIETSDLGVRGLSRRMGTSPAQLYRLLDTTNYRKSVDQMLRLLQALDAKVEVTVS
jgi:hypothetical protein